MQCIKNKKTCRGIVEEWSPCFKGMNALKVQLQGLKKKKGWTSMFQYLLKIGCFVGDIY